MPAVLLSDPLAFLGRYRRHGLSLENRIVAHQLLKTWLRENERDTQWLTTRIPRTDGYIARNVDRGPGAHTRFTLAQRYDSAAAMYEEDLIRDQMTMKLDLGTRCKLFVPHHEILRPTILAVDLDDEGSFAGVPPHATLSLAGL